MCNQDEIAMNAAGRTSSHRFRDLRSASLARKREIAKQKKYYHFRGLSPSDLHTPHYLPVCASPSCPTQGTPDDCWLSVFPANLSTAPLRVFTKREFYEEAQRWPRPPTYHHTYQKDKGKDPKRGETCKWDKMQYEKKQLRREMRSKGWRNEVDSFEERPCDCGCDFWHWFYLEILREELKFEDHDTEPEGLEMGLSGENMAGRSAEVGATPQVEEDKDWDIVSCASSISWIESVVTR
jgi:hypothetical protein